MQGDAHCGLSSGFVGIVSIFYDVTAAEYPKDGDSSCPQNLVLILQSAWLRIPDNIDFPVHCRKDLTSRLMWPVLNYATVPNCIQRSSNAGIITDYLASNGRCSTI